MKTLYNGMNVHWIIGVFEACGYVRRNRVYFNPRKEVEEDLIKALGVFSIKLKKTKNRLIVAEEDTMLFVKTFLPHIISLGKQEEVHALNVALDAGGFVPKSQYASIAYKREGGMSYAEIARHYNVTRQAIAYLFKKNKIKT